MALVQVESSTTATAAPVTSNTPLPTATTAPSATTQPTATAAPTSTTAATPTPAALGLGQPVMIDNFEIVISNVEQTKSVMWHNEPLKPEGMWVIVKGTARNLTTDRQNLSSREFALTTSNLSGRIRPNGDATGGAGLQLGVNSTVAGFAGMPVPAGQTVPLVVAFDVPATAEQLALYVGESSLAYDLGTSSAVALFVTPTPAPTPTTPPTAVPPTPTATPVPPQGQVVKKANLRDAPTTEGSTVLGQLDPGTVVSLLGRMDGGEWYQIATVEGQQGWMSASLLSIDAPVAEAVAVVPTPTPVPTPDPWHQAGGVALAVANVERHNALSRFQTASPGNVFLLIAVGIVNVDHDEAPYNPLYFKLKDADNFEYTPSIYTGDYGLHSGTLSRGDQVNGYIAFEVPKNATGLVLTYEPLVIFGGYEPIRISLP